MILSCLVFTVHVILSCLVFTVHVILSCLVFTVHVILSCALTFFQVFMNTPHLQFKYLAIFLGVQTVYGTLLRVLPGLMLPVRVRHGDVHPQ